ncbi:MAG: cation:proton antiporter [Hyphomonadaceae bacterium]|nr:cation:proton antiporter [Hyphomonadaceae bacterium]
MQDYALISTIVLGLVLAFVFGFIAQRLKLSTIVGYLLAGVAVGPYTPGFVGDSSLALQLAEIGVILLMFGVGLKFSLADLWSVRRIALPGALVQMGAATGLGYAFGWSIGLDPAQGLVLGVSLSVASTVVLLRALEERNLVKSENGRICVGWLVVEDVAIVLTIVLLPTLVAIGQGGSMSNAAALQIVETMIKIAAFVALMLIVGARLFPWFIVQVAHTKSRELMSLGTMALALGVAYAAYTLFDASFALGAFLAGVMLNGAKFTHKIAEDSQPLRDTFAVLFFVSVGMLFDPATLVSRPLEIAALLGIVVIGKGLAALALTTLFRLPLQTGLLVAVALAQIGEFSFVLAGMGRQFGLLDDAIYNLILAAALLSIAINPLLFKLVERFGPKAPEAAAPA